MIYYVLILILIIIFIKYKKNNYLIKDGRIIFKNLSLNYNLDSLIKDLVKNKIDDINNIEKAYYLFGHLWIKNNKPFVFIFNGRIDYDSLRKAGKNAYFVIKYLKKKSIKLEDILYAIYLNNKFYIVKN